MNPASMSFFLPREVSVLSMYYKKVE